MYIYILDAAWSERNAVRRQRQPKIPRLKSAIIHLHVAVSVAARDTFSIPTFSFELRLYIWKVPLFHPEVERLD